MYKLILADESELSVDLCGSYDGGPLYIDVVESNFIECAQIFSDAGKTSRMVYDYTAGQDVFEGYTDLIGLVQEDGLIKVTMRKATEA